jgi:hypothetical protein
VPRSVVGLLDQDQHPSTGFDLQQFSCSSPSTRVLAPLTRRNLAPGKEVSVPPRPGRTLVPGLKSCLGGLPSSRLPKVLSCSPTLSSAVCHWSPAHKHRTIRFCMTLWMPHSLSTITSLCFLLQTRLRINSSGFSSIIDLLRVLAMRADHLKAHPLA